MKKLIYGVMAVVVAMSVTACGGDKKAAENSEEKVPTVDIQSVAVRSVAQQTVLTGTVEAYVTNNIAPQSSRRISAIRFDVGDHVRKGDVLVTLDNSALVQAKAQLDNAKVEYDRTKELFDFGGASRSELDARAMQYDLTKSAYENMVENTKLICPVDGVVSARNYDNGDMSGANPILVIDQIRPVKIIVNVSETLFSKVKKGMKVDITLDAYGEEHFDGHISRITPIVDNLTHTFAVEVLVNNANERVRPGMFARVTLVYGNENRVVVSDRAIQRLTGAGDRYVYIVNEDMTVRYSRVELGRHMDTEYEILSGIENGDKVVVKGQSALTNGCKVELNK